MRPRPQKIPITPPDGLLLNGTDYEASGRWRKGNLIRFFRGSPQPVGGWTRIPLQFEDQNGVQQELDQIEGVCRGLISWRDNSENRWMAVGTTKKLYVFDGSLLIDITPASLQPGDENANYGSGYGAWLYGTDDVGPPQTAYGTERPEAITSIVQEPGAWTFATWGEDLIACANWDGRLWAYTPGQLADEALEITNGAGEVPQANRAVLVTDERHAMALGAGDWGGVLWEPNKRKIAWSTSEDREVWTPAVDNSAGDFNLETNGVIVTGTKFKNEIIVWTDVDVHRVFYTGAPYYYGRKKIASSSGILSVNAFVETPDFLFWVGPRGFFIYDGTVRLLQSEVSDEYRDSLNRTQIAKVAAGHNPEFKEIWVFYPSVDGNENDSYILWNYENNAWSAGKLNRTCWDAAEIWDNPVAALGNIVEPETGLTTDFLGSEAIVKDGKFGYFPDTPFVYQIDRGDGSGRRKPNETWPQIYTAVENVTITIDPNGTPVVYNEPFDIFQIRVDYDKGTFLLLSSFFSDPSYEVQVDYDIVGQNGTRLYNHETGYTDDGETRDIWLESAPFEIGNGDQVLNIHGIIQDTGLEDDPDPRRNSDAIEVEFDVRNAPEAASTTKGPYRLDLSRGYTDARFNGRQIVMRIRQIKDVLWRFGKLRLETTPGSRR